MANSSSQRRRSAVAAQEAVTPPPAPPSIDAETAPVVSDNAAPAPAPVPITTTTNQSNRKVSLALILLATFLLFYRIFATVEEFADTEDLPAPSGNTLMSQRGKKSSSSGEDVSKLKPSLEHSGWSPQIGSLVEKRPPRPCAKTELAVQMFDLLLYRTKKGAPRRAFTCLAKPCRDSILEDAMDRQWKQLSNTGANRLDATMVFADLKSLGELSPQDFTKLYFGREGSTYLDVVFGGLALSTLDALEQFAELATYTKEFGCHVNELQVMLPQYRSNDEFECLELRAIAEKSSRAQFSIATGGGSVAADQILTRLGDCYRADHGKPLLIKRPLSKPMLLEGKHRFTVRSFCLVGSTMPFMVFFRRGFVVLETGKFVSLEQFQRTLANNKITGTHFIDTFLQTSMKQIGLLMFQASRQHILRRRGSFQIFSLDFVVSEEMKIYLQGTDPRPNLPQAVVTDMLDLVMELGEEPGAFARMLTGDKYGSFELIFSELRETCEGASSFNPCQQFKQYNTQNLAKANKKISVTHNAFNREHHEETRVIKKLEEEKKAKCKEKGFSLESKACDKYAKALEAEEFEQLFAQHEKDWNPNAFKLAQPGEVFPWEIV